MKKIFKYPMHVESNFNVQLPCGAKILHFEAQGGYPMMWAEVHPEGEFENVRFHCHGTGHDVPEDGREFVGTVQIDSFVWHFYRGGK